MTVTLADQLELTHPSAESAVLAGMLSDGEMATEIAASLEPTDFHNERYGVIFEAIRGLLAGTEPVDKQAIVAECRRVTAARGVKFTVNESHLTFEGDPKRARNYAQTVKRLAWLRGAAGFAHWMVQELQARPDPDNLYGEAQERWSALRPMQKSSAFVYGWDTIGQYADALIERARPDNNILKLNWPWQSWNRMIRYLRPGQVGMVTAPDGIGKTTYLEMIAEHWAMLGAKVVYVHLEDDLEYKLDRRMARYAKVPLEALEDGTLTTQQASDVKEATANIGVWANHLHYYHAPGQSMAEIIRELETRVSEGECQAVVLDYINKVQATRAQSKLFGANTWERQSDDMEQFKNFCERCKLPGLTAAQGNKAMQGGGIQTRQNIEGGGGKSQRSQLVIILTRELIGEQGLKDKSGNTIAKMGDYSPIVDVRVDKQNRGQQGQFQQVLAGRFFTVRDLEIRETPA